MLDSAYFLAVMNMFERLFTEKMLVWDYTELTAMAEPSLGKSVSGRACL